MQNFIDLTYPHRIEDSEMRKLLNKPGFYRIPVRNYNVFTDDPVVKDVEVVYVTPIDARMLVIIIKIDDDTYQDFYYNDGNGCFKILTFNDFYAEEIDDEDIIEAVGGIDKIFTFKASWILENVRDTPPAELANYEVDRDIFQEHKFFNGMF